MNRRHNYWSGLQFETAWYHAENWIIHSFN